MSDSSMPHPLSLRALRSLSDDAWLAAHLDIDAAPPEIKAWLPHPIDPAVQQSFVGVSGERAIRDGFKIYQMIREIARRHGVALAPRSHVLDFGVGWGRVVRYFVHDVDPDTLISVDCLPLAVETTRTSLPWSDVRLIDGSPPSGLLPATFDLIYLYSVFSHLSEEAHLRWVAEFHRLLKPGGLLVATTRSRWWITLSDQMRKADPPPAWAGDFFDHIFVDTEAELARYDRGDFCHTPLRNVPPLDGMWGETCIPHAYAARRWRDFEVVEFIDDPSMCDQAVIVATPT